MIEKTFSDGFNGTLYEANEFERLWFPRANLVKVNKLPPREISDPREEFYRNKIAKLMFPSLFPDLVAVRFNPTEHFPAIFHSTKIPGLEEHATYTSHTIDKNPDVRNPHRRVIKASECNCPDCQNHRVVHSNPQLLQLANLTGRMLYYTGIAVDSKDQTDFCNTDNGIVFFETNYLMKPDILGFLKEGPQGVAEADFSDVPELDKFIKRNYKLAQLPSILPGLAERYFRLFDRDF